MECFNGLKNEFVKLCNTFTKVDKTDSVCAEFEFEFSELLAKYDLNDFQYNIKLVESEIIIKPIRNIDVLVLFSLYTMENEYKL